MVTLLCEKVSCLEPWCTTAFKGNEYTVKEGISPNCFCLPSEKETFSKKKEFAPLWCKFFLSF